MHNLRNSFSCTTVGDVHRLGVSAPKVCDLRTRILTAVGINQLPTEALINRVIALFNSKLVAPVLGSRVLKQVGHCRLGSPS